MMDLSLDLLGFGGWMGIVIVDVESGTFQEAKFMQIGNKQWWCDILFQNKR